MRQAAVALLFLFLSGCAAKELVYYEVPRELQGIELKSDFMLKYGKYVQGKKFYIDPGHGGKDRVSVGNLGKVTEADVNLSVALSLRDYLQEAGAQVIMSRSQDATVDLKQRSIEANNSGADFFISVHHNAPGKDSESWINYTSTYYHATENDYEYEPSERDLARYIQRDLAYAMRNAGGPGSFDGTYSDYSIYPKAGFSVLRVTEIPAVLVECGFFTNNFEERRLALEDFNRIQAWGIFRGIARFLSAGIPQISFINEKETFTEGPLLLNFEIKDSTGIDPVSVKAQFDSVDIKETKLDLSSKILTVVIPAAAEGDHVIRIIAANKNGNHSLPFHKKIQVISKNAEP